MKKQRKQLVFMLVLLLLIIAGYWGLLQYNKSQANKEEEEQAATLLVTAEASNVTELSYIYEDTICQFVKEQGTWKAAEDKELNLNQTRIENMVSKAVGMKVVSQIDGVTNLLEYGLEEPSNTITFVADGITYKIAIGDKNAVTSYYYITLDDSNIVYLVEGTSITGFTYSVEDLIEEPETTEVQEDAVTEDTTTE